MSTKSGGILEQKAPTAKVLLGVYPQKQDGLFMQRIKIFGGRISWPQWRRIAQLAIQYSTAAVHITTRQDIELHNLRLEDTPAVHDALAEVALATFASCGDSVRNMTISTGCEYCEDEIDLLPLAQLVRQYLEQQPVIFQLHRKFKISFSGCFHSAARPWLNDLGFVVCSDGLFTAIGAGSLGPRPALGIELYKDLPAKDVLPLCIAALELFAEHGERRHRHKARLRHLRERFGDEAFRQELDRRFLLLKSLQPWPDISLVSSSKNFKLLTRLQLPNGNISPSQAIELADAAEPKGAVLRINLEHGLELYGTEYFELPDNLAALSRNPVIVACPGCSTCPKALADTWSLADRIRDAIAGRQRTDVRINISGCPNSCAHSAVADIGLAGIKRKQGDKVVECYRLFTGGGNGNSDKLAEQTDIVSAADAPAVVQVLWQML